MKFTEFKIKKFKGIDEVVINFSKSPNANIYTLVGLNESGKTTILEAINFFNKKNEGLNALELPGSIIDDYNNLIPISRRDNFSDVVELEVTLSFSEDDMEKVNNFAMENTVFSRVRPRDTDKVFYYRKYHFKDSKFEKAEPRWSGFWGIPKDSTTNQFVRVAEISPSDNPKLSTFCEKLLPSILYFPNFLFDFPSKIYLESKSDISEKEKFYLELIQDILFSLDNNTDYDTHIISRAKSDEKNDQRNLDSLLKKMNKKVTDTVFDAWNTIFKREIKDTQVVMKCGVDDEQLTFLEFEIEAPDGIYQINERSLGFRWFFTFLLFTQFRPYRKNSPQNVIFLFDEPASNLHSSAQKQLLKSFEILTKDCQVIYTTHSHHLINPHWLESTYVVKNEGLRLENPETYNITNTDIRIQPYREFVLTHPHNTAYFQPILDVLDYSPSNLENVQNCIFLEGKSDFYALEYFDKIILANANSLSLAPSTSASNLDIMISLYIGWGKNFIVLLDSDREGNDQRQRYINEFGAIVENRIFTLNDIDPTWAKIGLERLFHDDEKLVFQQTSYPESTKFNKTHFSRSVQENLMKRTKFDFEVKTIENFKKILAFIGNKLTELNGK